MFRTHALISPGYKLLRLVLSRPRSYRVFNHSCVARLRLSRPTITNTKMRKHLTCRLVNVTPCKGRMLRKLYSAEKHLYRGFMGDLRLWSYGIRVPETKSFGLSCVLCHSECRWKVMLR